MPIALFIEISHCCVADFLQPQYSATQFTEEFDFTAMNEKFKKDEVWGYLGKGKDKTGGVQGFTTGQSLVEGGMVTTCLSNGIWTSILFKGPWLLLSNMVLSVSQSLFFYKPHCCPLAL